MKKIYLLLMLLIVSFSLKAQTITFFDNNFKLALLEASPSNLIAFDRLDNPVEIDRNHDGEIQQSETENVYRLRLISRSLTNLSGIEFFTNLTYLECNNNNLTSLFLADLSELYSLDCSFNQLTNLNVSGLQNLKVLDFSFNRMQEEIPFSQTPNLQILRCSSNGLTRFDVSQFPGLLFLDCSANALTVLDISNSHQGLAVVANGNNLNTILMNNGFLDNVDFNQNPFITNICADVSEHNTLRSKIISYGYNEANISVSDCSLNVEEANTDLVTVLYPNPANQFLNIKLEKENIVESVNIYNTLGQLMLIENDFRNQIVVTNLKAGNYVVRAITSKGILTAKFIKI